MTDIFEIWTVDENDNILTCGTVFGEKEALEEYKSIGDDERKALVRVDDDGNILEEIESNYKLERSRTVLI